RRRQLTAPPAGSPSEEAIARERRRVLVGFAALGIWGGAWGAHRGSLDVAVNTAATEAEERTQRSIMSLAHGLFSIGVIVMAAVGTLIAALATLVAVVLGGIAVAGLGTSICAPILLSITATASTAAAVARRWAPSRRSATSASRWRPPSSAAWPRC
ncbi:MAG: hypothetical protein ABWZ52_06790, partial [Acidimicrobiales bacterium]